MIVEGIVIDLRSVGPPSPVPSPIAKIENPKTLRPGVRKIKLSFEHESNEYDPK